MAQRHCTQVGLIQEVDRSAVRDLRPLFAMDLDQLKFIKLVTCERIHHGVLR